MKIENSTTTLPTSSVNEASTRAAMAKNVENAKPVVAEEMGTSVSLGATTAQLRSLGANTDAPQVDANKVAEIKRAIAEGRFQVNSGAVADRLLSSVRELIDASKR